MAKPESRSRSETVVAATFASRLEADSARVELEAQGIGSMVMADDCGGMRPHLAFTGGGAKLLVLSENLERARELLGRTEDG